MEVQLILKMVLAGEQGVVIGLEREVSHRDVGIKINVLIAVGSTLMTVLTLRLVEQAQLSGPVIGHIITALGLISAAIIIRERFLIHGVTTAATAWGTGAIGIIIGCGWYLAAFLAAIFLVGLLLLLRYISITLEKQIKAFAYVITAEENVAVFIEIKRILVDLGLKYSDTKIKKIPTGYEVEITVTTSPNRNKAFIERVMHLPFVKEISSDNL